LRGPNRPVPPAHGGTSELLGQSTGRGLRHCGARRRHHRAA
jgi:hypothetical protein